MRIISGELGGRKIMPPPDMPFTRPTTDVAKEGLFNILQHKIDFESITQALDLFGGTGSISYELISRGVEHVDIIEKDSKMHAFIKNTATNFKIASHINVIRMDVFAFLQNIPPSSYDFIFAGPPYALQQIDDIPKLVHQRNILKPQGIFVLEHTPRNNYENYPLFVQQRNYGTTVFSFFKQL